jgi:hypothetical protein
MIVHLNGRPGVGKRTVGSFLANHLGARFIHNHLLHDVAIVCTGFDDPERWVLYDLVRHVAYASLRKRPPTEVFVMTNALCKNAPRELEAWRHVVELAMSRNVPLVPIVLEATAECGLHFTADGRVVRVSAPAECGARWKKIVRPS